MDPFEIATAVLRGSHLIAALSLFGCLVFRCWVMPKAPERPLVAAVHRIGLISGALALFLGAAWLVAVSGTITGANDFATLLDAVPVVARHTIFGEFTCLRLLLLAGALGLLATRFRLVALLAENSALRDEVERLTQMIAELEARRVLGETRDELDEGAERLTR